MFTSEFGTSIGCGTGVEWAGAGIGGTVGGVVGLGAGVDGTGAGVVAALGY